MAVELNIMSPAWANFLNNVTDIHGTAPYPTITLSLVNLALKEYQGYVKDPGEWQVKFETDQALSFFLLRWA